MNSCKINVLTEQLYDKKFEFSRESNWTIDTNEVFLAERFDLDQFQELKRTLTFTKNKLSSISKNEWRSFTSSTDLSELVVPHLRSNFKPELLTRAWTKFYSIICEYSNMIDSDTTLHSLHLCEAPGAFISALNHYIQLNHPLLQWTWNANSLEPFYEGNSLKNMIFDDRLMRHTKSKWNFGYDGTGDLTNIENCKQIISDYSKQQNVSLVTADGSEDCSSNPNDQEITVSFLLYCEVLTAFSVLCKNGSFVLKMFTCFEHFTICLMYLIICSFEKVIAFKPCTSKSGNSEIYLVCLRFLKPNLSESFLAKIFANRNFEKSMFCKDDLPASFLVQLLEMVKFFQKMQIETIENNLLNFQDPDFDVQTLKHLKIEVCTYFACKYRISQIVPAKRIVRNTRRLKLSYSSVMKKRENVFVADSQYKIREKAYENLEIEIVIGKVIVEIISSTYCDNLDCVKKFFEAKIETNNLFVMYSTNYELIELNKTLFYNNQLLFMRFYDILKKIKDGYDLILVNFIFITRFHFSLIFLVAHCFDFVQFSLDFILLKNFSNSRLSNVNHFFDLIDKSFGEKVCSLENQTILSFLPIDLIFKGKFRHKIYNYNNHRLSVFDS